MTLVEDIVVRKLGRADYLPTWQAMREFTRGRQESTPDELWLVEHPPVYTVGQGASIPSLVSTIPVVKTDRGGDITYHGPGQVVLYALVCEDGTVQALSEAPGTEEPRLVQPAMEAVRRWTYVPATKDGKPLAVAMTVIVSFR